MTSIEELRAKALIWWSRPPSRRFVLHRIPLDRWCPLRGPVTRYHGCRVCEPEFFGEVLIAQSLWIGRVPTGPATMSGGRA